MRRLSVLLLGATFVLTACSDDDLTNPPYTSSAPSAESSYAVMTDDAWTLHEAIDPPADAPIVARQRDGTTRSPVAWDHFRGSVRSGDGMIVGVLVCRQGCR